MQLPGLTTACAATSYVQIRGFRPETARSTGAIRHLHVSVLLFSLTSDLKCDLQFHFTAPKDLALTAPNTAEMWFVFKLLLCTDVKSRL